MNEKAGRKTKDYGKLTNQMITKPCFDAMAQNEKQDQSNGLGGYEP